MLTLPPTENKKSYLAHATVREDPYIVLSRDKIQCVSEAPMERTDTLTPSSQEQPLLMASPGMISISSETIATQLSLAKRSLGLED